MKTILKKKITQERLKEVYHYDPETGIFTYLGDDQEPGKRPPGRPRLPPTYEWKVNPRTTIDGESLYFSHLAWLYVYGEIPRRLVHVNKNFLDLRIKNLYVPVEKIPAHKRKFPGRRGTISKVMGVSYHKSSGLWQAQLLINGKRGGLIVKTFLDAVFTRYAMEQCAGIEVSKNRFLNSAGNYLKKRGLVAK